MSQEEKISVRQITRLRKNCLIIFLKKYRTNNWKTGSVSMEKMFYEISQTSQGNNCVAASF